MPSMLDVLSAILTQDFVNVSGYSGNAGDRISERNGFHFSTPDHDRDDLLNKNCAKSYNSFW